MKQKQLTAEQSIRAAIIFLNLFGLRLEYGEKINQDEVLSILNSQNQEAGMLTFDNDKISISTMSSFGKIDATCKYAALEDIESNNEWFTNLYTEISFSFIHDNAKFSGTFKLNCSADQRFGLDCRPHFTMEYKKNKNNYFILKVQEDGSFFKIEHNKKKTYERIDMRPHDNFSGYIVHDIKDGDYISGVGYPNRTFNCISTAGYSLPDTIKTYKLKSHYSNIIYENVKYYKSVGDDSLAESVIQKGELMHEIDSDMFEKIAKLREYFKKDDCSLLDNLISICYTSYNDKEIKACLGIDRNKMQYQNNADSLIEAYFGIGEDNKFFSLETQKRLLKSLPSNNV